MNPNKAQEQPNPPGYEACKPGHAGLALQRYLPRGKGEGGQGAHTITREFLQKIVEAGLPPAYPGFFKRWKEALTALGAVWLEATTSTPLAIGLGNASPLEVGLTLHHTYGTPYLPGSALKGLLRRVAAQAGLNEKERAVILGEGPNPQRRSSGSAAYLVFWDGLLDPGSRNPLQLDVITPHHTAYYQTGGEAWPTDFDDPVPVPFLSVKPGSVFWIAITYQEGGLGWANLAAELLAWGLTHLGLGAKTHSGYGYFLVKPERKEEVDVARKVHETLRPFVEKITQRDPVRAVRELGQRLVGYPPEQRGLTIEAARQRVQELKLEKKALDEIQSILKSLESGEKENG